ncbi:hypothetical protein KGM_200965A, partial [Danaus plexippus plexippus]
MEFGTTSSCRKRGDQ